MKSVKIEESVGRMRTDIVVLKLYICPHPVAIAR